MAGELQENQGLNSGIPKHRGQDEETKKQIQARLDRSGKARLRGGIRTLQNLEDGVTDAAEQQQHVEDAKVADKAAGEEAHAEATK